MEELKLKNNYMRKILIITILFLGASIFSFSQSYVKIGELEFGLHSPITVTRESNFKKGSVKINEFFIGGALMLNTKEQIYLPVNLGESYNLEFGWSRLYRFGRHFAAGTVLQFTSLSYSLTPQSYNNEFFEGIIGDVKDAYYRTGNVGTGIFTRYWLGTKRSSLYLDLGAYLNYAYDRKVKVKTIVDGDLDRYKIRASEKFNPVEAGFTGGVGIRRTKLYLRYRATNLFNSNFLVDELPRWSLGVQFTM